MNFEVVEIVALMVKFICGIPSLAVLIFYVFPNVKRSECTQNGKFLLFLLLFYISLLVFSHIVEAFYVLALKYAGFRVEEQLIQPLRIPWLLQFIFLTAQVGCTATYTFELLEGFILCRKLKRFQDAKHKAAVEFTLILIMSMATSLGVIYNQNQTNKFLLTIGESSIVGSKYILLCFLQSGFLVLLSISALVARWKLKRSRKSTNGMDSTSLNTRFNNMQYLLKLERLLPMVGTMTIAFFIYNLIEAVIASRTEQNTILNVSRLIFSEHNKFPIVCLLLTLSAAFGTSRVLKKKTERVERIELDMISHRAQNYFDHLDDTWNA